MIENEVKLFTVAFWNNHLLLEGGEEGLELKVWGVAMILEHRPAYSGSNHLVIIDRLPRIAYLLTS